jgi:prepilin-type N-terminal cleavage/methylation domain-containing protein
MIRVDTGWSGRPPRHLPRRSGFTLMELIVALVIMSVLLAMGVPRFTLCLEQSRAHVAGANLRAIWSAQRLYWLQNPNRMYAPDLPTLANLIDPSLATATAPYVYSVSVPTDGSTFTATATRAGTGAWSGEFTIAADGSFSGSVQQAGQGTTIVPSFQ